VVATRQPVTVRWTPAQALRMERMGQTPMADRRLGIERQQGAPNIQKRTGVQRVQLALMASTGLEVIAPCCTR
jgi:hypothetical protein